LFSIFLSITGKDKKMENKVVTGTDGERKKS